MVTWNSSGQGDHAVKSAMDIMCENLDTSSTPFAEQFPNYNNEIIYPLRVFDGISEGFSNFIAKTAGKIVESQASALFKTIESGVYDAQLSNTILKNSITAMSESSSSIVPADKAHILDPNIERLIYHGSETFKAILDLSQAYPEIMFIPIGFLYYRVVKTYVVVNYPISQFNQTTDPKIRSNLIMSRMQNIKYLMFGFAPLITMGLYAAIHPRVKAKSLVQSRLGFNSVSESLLLLFSLKKVKANTRNISSNNTTPPKKENYIYIILLSLVLSYICLKLIGLIGLKSVLFYYLILLIIMYMYIIIDFLIIIYYIKYQITTPKYLPDFIQNQLIPLEMIIKSGDSAIKILLHIKTVNFLAYSLLLLLSFIFYFLL